MDDIRYFCNYIYAPRKPIDLDPSLQRSILKDISQTKTLSDF